MVADPGEAVNEAAPVPDVERQRGELAELTAARREMVASVNRQIDFYVEHFGKTPREAEAEARKALPFDPAARPADQVSWWEIQHALEADHEQGQALWGAIRDEARRELATGFRAARAVEADANGRPLDRAHFLAIRDALRSALGPRDGLEHLLVDQMASAYDLHLRWQAKAVQRGDLDAWHGETDRRRELANMSPARRERYEADHGWLPPRLPDAAAIDQAVLIADRYQRSFLRLMKAFRDNRRLFGALIVAGGQINIGEQQVNVHRDPPPVERIRIRRTAAARMRGANRPT